MLETHEIVVGALLVSESWKHFHFKFESKHSKLSSKYYAGSVIVNSAHESVSNPIWSDRPHQQAAHICAMPFSTHHLPTMILRGALPNGLGGMHIPAPLLNNRLKEHSAQRVSTN